jgi:MFS family permease
MALSPGFILSSALGLVRPIIAESLGTSPGSIFWALILGNAALALGAVLAADLAQRFKNRLLFMTYQGAFILGSVVAFLAPNAGALVLGYTLQGLATGLLLVAALPPLVTGFPAHRLKTTIPAVVIGLFGAVTAGPLVGGYFAMTGAWRVLFLATVLVGLATLVLALVALAEREPLNPGAHIDATALLLSAGGTGLSFVGVGELMRAGAGSPTFYVPVSLGILMLASLVVLEGVRSAPLMPVRPLTTTFPLMGILAAIISGAAFTGLVELTLLFLERVRGLDVPAAGFLFWPELVMGIVGALIVGFVLTSRWVLTMPLFGMISLSLAAWWLTGITASSGDLRILAVAAALGLGASLTVTPGLLMAALSVPPLLVGRAIALVELLRLVSAYTVGPVLLYIARSYGSRGQSLLTGIHTGYWIILGFMLAGMLVITLIYLRGGARLHPPGLETFLNEGEPAFDSPPVKKEPAVEPEQP